MNRNLLVKKVHIITVLFLLTSCAVKQTPLQSELIQSEESSSAFVLQEAVTMKANNSARTRLRAGTVWLKVGTIEQGTVYRTRDQVVILNSFDVHEAFIVVKDNEAAGYYLPGKKTFVKSKPVSITLVKKVGD